MWGRCREVWMGGVGECMGWVWKCAGGGVRKCVGV